MLIYQLAYFMYLSLVASVKSFLRLLDLITCDNDYLYYTALTTLKAHDSCLWYWIVVVLGIWQETKDYSRLSLKERLGQSLLEMEANMWSEVLELWTFQGCRFFEDVWYVDGLKANLLNISHICDNGLNVLFTKYECEILDGGDDCMCVGVRTADNCYGLTPSISNKCFSAKIDQVDFW